MSFFWSIYIKNKTHEMYSIKFLEFLECFKVYEINAPAISFYTRCRHSYSDIPIYLPS
jgi:hypothetical protein